MKEIELLYRRLTKVVETTPINDVADYNCSYCGRGHEEFESRGIVFVDSYKRTQYSCPACYSFFTANTEILGLKVPTEPDNSNKFGMFSGCGALIETKNNGKAIFFAPPGITKKLPKLFFDQVDVLEIVATKQIEWIFENKEELSFPLLWVNDFGRKTDHLIKNLQFSTSPSRLIACTDAELNSTNKSNRIIDLTAAAKLHEKLTGLTTKVKNLFIMTVNGLASGRFTPANAGQIFKDNPVFKELITLLPTDPHLRKKILPLINKLKANKTTKATVLKEGK